jgi:hypothetical protein
MSGLGAACSFCERADGVRVPGYPDSEGSRAHVCGTCARELLEAFRDPVVQRDEGFCSWHNQAEDEVIHAWQIHGSGSAAICERGAAAAVSVAEQLQRPGAVVADTDTASPESSGTTASVPTGVSSAHDRLMALLHETRVDLQDFQAAMAAVAARASGPAEVELAGAVAELFRVFAELRRKIDRRLLVIEELWFAFPELHKWAADQLERFRNVLDQIVILAERLPLRGAEVAWSAADIDLLVDECGYRLALLTTPDRLNDQLRAVWPGQALDLEKVLRDELPKEQLRRRIFEALEGRPFELEGEIDPLSGTLYRSSPSLPVEPERRRWR